MLKISCKDTKSYRAVLDYLEKQQVYIGTTLPSRRLIQSPPLKPEQIAAIEALGASAITDDQQHPDADQG